MSAQHRWLQCRLARICERLGYNVIVEDHRTDSDVLVYSKVPGLPDLSIEVQRWSTKFETRTKSRRDRGAAVLWLLTEDATGKGVSRALFNLPAARVRVHRDGNRSVPFAPWDHPEQNPAARLSIGATAAKWNPARQLLTTGNVSAATFLAEILDGRRSWTANPPGLRHGGWVLQNDLQLAQQAARRTTRQPGPVAGIGNGGDSALAPAFRVAPHPAQAASPAQSDGIPGPEGPILGDGAPAGDPRFALPPPPPPDANDLAALGVPDGGQALPYASQRGSAQSDRLFVSSPDSPRGVWYRLRAWLRKR